MPTNQNQEGHISNLGKFLSLIDKYTLIAITVWMCYRDWRLETKYESREIIRETFYQQEITRAIKDRIKERDMKYDSLNRKYLENDTL